MRLWTDRWDGWMDATLIAISPEPISQGIKPNMKCQNLSSKRINKEKHFKMSSAEIYSQHANC